MWSFPVPSSFPSGSKCVSLCFRPDGKVIALGYDQGSLVLLEVEHCAQICHVEGKEAVTAITWIDCKDRAPKNKDFLKK